MLAITPIRYLNESLMGYRCRVAGANGYNTWGQFKRAWIDAASIRSGLDLLHTETCSFLGVELSDKSPQAESILRLKDIRRVCPACISEAPFLRSAWEHALLPHCLDHERLLIGHCPVCTKQLRHTRTGITCCGSCGCDLRMTQPAPPTEISLLERLLADRIAGIASDNRQELGTFTSLSATGLENLAFLLGSYVVNARLSKPRKTPVRSDVCKAAEVISAADQLMSNWPDSFIELLDRQRKHQANCKRIQTHVGYLYRAVYKEFHQPEFQFLRQVLDRYIESHWDGLISSKNHWQSTRLRQCPPFESSTRLARRIGARRNEIHRWITDGSIEGSIRSLASGRQQALVRRGQDRTLSRLLASRTLQQSAEDLALPERRLRELLLSGVLRGDSAARGSRWRITQIELERLLEKLRKVATPIGDDLHQVSLDYIFRHGMYGGITFPGILQALLTGEIRFSLDGQKTAFSSIQIDHENFLAWRNWKNTMLSVPQVAVRLHIKQEVAYHLVRQGLIRSANQTARGVRISEAAILEFSQDYCFATEIRDYLGCSPKSLMPWLEAHGVIAKAGPQIDGCRQYVFSRKDITPLFDELC